MAKLAESRGMTGLAAALHRRAEIEQSRVLPVLYETLSCDKKTPFCSSNTLYYSNPSFPRCGRRQYTFRCAPSFHGTSLFEWLMYRVKDAVLRDGQAMVVENSRACGWQRLVAKRADQSVSPTGCVLTK